jgi:excisionase family DNA binding protein
VKHLVRQFEAAQLLTALKREREIRGRAWPPSLDGFLRDLEARVWADSAQAADIALELHSARPQDAGMQTLSIAEAARTLGVHRSTMARMVDRGELPAIRVGARLRIRVAALERIAEGRKP